jgi:hypothetical protein
LGTVAQWMKSYRWLRKEGLAVKGMETVDEARKGHVDAVDLALGNLECLDEGAPALV